MARTRSPAYPALPLGEAIEHAQRIFNGDHRHSIPRHVAVKHMGYSSLNGASLTTLSAVGKYGLLDMERGNVRVSDRAMDILVEPKGSEKYCVAIREAAMSPKLFAALRDLFGVDSLPSDEALRAHLLKQGFNPAAVGDVIRSYRDTMELVAEVAEEYGSPKDNPGPSNDDPEPDAFGGAHVGDHIQWESEGTLRLPEPRQIRAISDDGNWVFVHGSQTGIPMNEVIVQERAPAADPPTPPTLPLETGGNPVRPVEIEWLQVPVGKGTSARVMVRGDMGPKEITRLVSILEMQRDMLTEEDEGDHEIDKNA